MLKIKLGRVNKTLEVLNSLAHQKLSVSASFNINKLGNKLVEEAKFYNQKRLELCEKHCERNEKGEPVLTKDQFGKDEYSFGKNEEAFIKEMEELMNLDVEFNLKPIPVYALETASITPAEIAIIDPFLI